MGLGGLLDSVLFPASCMGCKSTGQGYLCANCRGSAFGPRLSRVGGRSLWALGRYDGLLKECLVTIKQRGHKALAKELAAAAAEALVEALPREQKIAYVMAVPASKQGQKFRGFSVPQMMEDSVRELTGWPTLPTHDRRVYRSLAKSSQGMNREERLGRMREVADEVAQVASSGALLLLDDVVTTGATLSRCIAQAEKQGFQEILCAALAEYREE